jgi:hypothetical protein
VSVDSPLLVSWIGTGWPAIEVIEHADPMVGRKGEHPHSVGWYIL